MQKIKLKVAGVLLALVSVILGVNVGNGNVPVLGSVEYGQSYSATTTNTQALWRNYNVIQGSAIGNISPAGTRVATSVPTVLGSVIITSPGAKFCLYDATSTVPNGEWATTTIACFAASTAAGTYTFDAQYQKGILLEHFTVPTVSSWASSTITYR